MIEFAHYQRTGTRRNHRFRKPRRPEDNNHTTMTDPISEGFGNVPNASADFGNIPHVAETFRTIRNGAERTDQHTLTVREVARQFEDAGVPRTERSIINWCQPNRQGIARLDAYFDANERKYFITGQSVHLAIKEEQAKQPPTGAMPKEEAAIPKRAETPPRHDAESNDRIKELERQNRDLEIATRAKDYYLERLEKDRDQFANKLVGMSRYVGELETQLLQLGGAPSGDRSLSRRSEGSGDMPPDLETHRPLS